MRKIATRTLAVVLLLAFGSLVWAQFAPVPPLPDAERRTTYAAAGIGPYNVGFALYGDSTDYQNWIQVYVGGVATTGYTLSSPSGVIGNLPLPITDAQITFSSAPSGTIQIIGARRPRRLSQLSENRGVSAHDFNVIITDIIAQLREVWDKTQNRIVQVPPGETQPVLPPAASRANQNATFDSNGNLTPSLPVTNTANVSAAMQPVVAAATISSAASQLGVTPVPIGVVLNWPGPAAPANYDFASGQAYSRVNFPGLMAALTSSQSGTCTNGSTTITGLTDTSQFGNGQRIEGSRIPSLNNTIVSVLSSTSIQAQSAATSTGSCTIQVFPHGNGDGLTTFNLPNYNGYVLVARDNMGGSAANVIQASTTISTTNGSPTSTVASGAGIAAGQVVVSANVPAGTTVLSISGTSVTLSANATATASGITARFSAITDAQALASIGGATTKTLALNEAPSHQHNVYLKDPGHNHSVIGTVAAQSGGGVNGSGGSTTTGTSTTGVTIGSVNGVANDNLTTAVGGGAAHSIVTPTKMVNYIIRIQ